MFMHGKGAWYLIFNLIAFVTDIINQQNIIWEHYKNILWKQNVYVVALNLTSGDVFYGNNLKEEIKP